MCSKHISTIPLSTLKNKRIVIDIQVYLYLFQCLPNNTNLIQNMYMMCLLFHKYEIKPLFVFDNRSSNSSSNKAEKRKQRRMEGKNAQKKIQEMIVGAASGGGSVYVPQNLKQKTIKVSHIQISRVKRIIDLFGFQHVDAPEEADELCAYLVETQQAWGCLSNDTDMMACGCKNVLQNLNMTTHTIQHINVRGVIQQVGATLSEFREICALSQNDYNCKDKTIPLFTETIQMFNEYRDTKSDIIISMSFHEWFLSRRNNSESSDDDMKKEQFNKIYEMFDISKRTFPSITFLDNKIDDKGLKDFAQEFNNCFYCCESSSASFAA